MPEEIIETPEEKMEQTKALIRRRGMLKFIFSDWQDDDIKDLPTIVQDALRTARTEFNRECPTSSDKIKKLWPTIMETCSDIKKKFSTAEEYLEYYSLTSEVQEAGDGE